MDRLVEYTDESIVAELRRVAGLVGKPKLSTREFTQHSRIGLNTVRRHLGSWRDALRAAGLQELFNEVTVTRKTREQLGRRVTDQEVMGEIRRVAEHLGKDSLTVEEFNEHAKVSAGTVRTRFGTWREGLQAAGLTPVNHGRRYTDEDCFENLLAVWTHYGRPPKYQEMNRAPSEVGGKAYTVRWGSWNRSLAAFVERINSDAPAEEAAAVPSPIPSSNERSTEPPERKRSIPLSLRYRVLRRDRFMCVLCGRSPAQDPGCELHVDHIVAFSKGGKSVEGNLRSLCRECNLGKGDKDE